MQLSQTSRLISKWIFAFCGLWLIGLGFYFIFIRPSLLPEDTEFMGTTLSQIRTSLPGLENWLSKVFTVMGGFIAGAGVLILYVGFVIIPLRLRGTGLVMVMSGALTVALMSITNFAINSDFKWALLFPVAMWMSGVFFYFKKV